MLAKGLVNLSHLFGLVFCVLWCFGRDGKGGGGKVHFFNRTKDRVKGGSSQLFTHQNTKT